MKRFMAGLVCVGAVGATALASPPRSVARPTEPATIAFEGVTIVIPLSPADEGVGAVWLPAREPRVMTADGERVESSLVFIAVRPVMPRSAEHDHDAHGDEAEALSSPGWLPEGPVYTVTAYRAMASSRRAEELMTEQGVGFWALLCDPPAGARLDGLMIDDVRHPLRPTARDAFAPGRDERGAGAGAWREVGEMVRPLAEDPFQRWRVRLLEDRVGSELLWGDAGAPGPIERRELEALAVQMEQTWRAALALVSEADGDAAEGLARALTAVAAMPTGGLAPVWPVEEGSHASLLRSLTVEGLDAPDAARRARSYVDSLAPVRVTVTDDNQGMVGVTELRGRVAEVTVGERRLTVGAFGTGTAVIAEHPDAGGASTALARSGGWSSRVAAVNGAPVVRPPGFRVGPVYTPWTLAEWRADRASPTLGEQACAALVQRAPGEGGGAAVWQVYVECSAGHQGPPAGDEVVLYFGGGRGPVIERRVDAGGAIRDGKGNEVARFPTVFNHGSWWVIVAAPEGAIEPDGTMLLAMERRDGAGWRATWPRPLLPGQARPGPVRLDLNAWDGGLSR